MINLRNIWRPEAYHGFGRRPPFFEGWYFKMVDATEQHRHAIIPGVFIGAERGSSHAFVQILDGVTGHSTYHRYPFEAFVAAQDKLDIRVGPNRFRRDVISLDISSPGRTLQGELRFEGGHPWPVTLTSPGIMGWYALVPFMECYHGVLSFDHKISGHLAVDGTALDFSGGRGYIEKDWGQSFPQAWIWMQSNHFGTPGTSVTASVAVIPWLRGAFVGFIAGLWHEGCLYRFATYTGARLERQETTAETVILHYVDRRPSGHRLEIVATRAHGGLLHSPERVAMLQRVMESLTATIRVRLVEIGSGRVVFEDEGRHAGLEVVGDLPGLGGTA
jgi:tocopherol cyclase